MDWKKSKMGLRVSLPSKKHDRSPKFESAEGLRVSLPGYDPHAPILFPGYDNLNEATRRVLLESMGVDPSMAFTEWANLPRDIQTAIMNIEEIERFVRIGQSIVPVKPLKEVTLLGTMHHVAVLNISSAKVHSTFGKEHSPGLWMFVVGNTPVALQQIAPDKYEVLGYNLLAYDQMRMIFPDNVSME